MPVKITIISINSQSEQNGRPNVQYDVEVEKQSSVNATLDAAFMLTNADNRPFGNSVCSTSTGDILIMNSRHYLVEGCGFKELTLSESLQIQKLTSRDTNFGYDFLVKQKLIVPSEATPKL